MPALRIAKGHPNLSITIETEPCQDSPEFSFFNAETNRYQEPSPGFADAVYEVEARADGCWGWCDVTVRATLGGLEGTGTLSQCSYLSEADFKAGGYYEQMEAEALAELQTQIDLTYALIHLDD